MKYTKSFINTTKETPSDAEVLSHQMMLRAGMIRKIAAGIYTYSPIGLKIIRKFEAIVREEINRIGGQEILMPSMIPSELWERTDRWEKYGKELLRVQDRHGKWFCYGPTHEEVVTELAGHYIRSYRQLPVILYQIQTKFRDEIRPRFGLMRGREFIMKDAYSFHKNEQELDATYQAFAEAYARIFKRCGLDVKVVKADSGAIGGDVSAEFMVTAPTGEDAILECGQCEYAANSEVLTEEETLENSLCPECKKNNIVSQLKVIRGIEVGHIFKLGTLYSEKLGAKFLDESGASLPMIMGCYGIGIGRTVAATIEQLGSSQSMCWPVALAPYAVSLIVCKSESPFVEAAETLYQRLLTQKIDVLLDDRTDSMGVKFKDTALLGIPFQIVIGKKYAETQEFEIKDRKTEEVLFLAEDKLISYLTEKIHGA